MTAGADWDDDEWPGNPHLLALRELAALRPELDRLEASLVDELRSAAYSWAEIAAALGLSKTGVYRRHAAHDPTAARRRARRAERDEPDAWL